MTQGGGRPGDHRERQEKRSENVTDFSSADFGEEELKSKRHAQVMVYSPKMLSLFVDAKLKMTSVDVSSVTSAVVPM